MTRITNSTGVEHMATFDKNCPCQTAQSPERLQFARCVRGFILQTGNNYDIPATYAFDRIEDLAAWLVEQYAGVPA